ncbi:MAG: hypothetical protein P1V51_02920 [Deltaproteobacteria bacterium]|nr:hypothetical protein [Deltaproteobacteria bacterium]
MKLPGTLSLLALAGILMTTGCDCGGAGAGGVDGAVDADGGLDGGLDGSWAGDGGWGGDGGGGACVPVICQGGTPYACANCLDDDNDGLIDFYDPDCLGPCDNNEEGFATEIPGGHSPGCGRECYFDKDNGGGNDNCAWSTECDPLAPEANLGCDYDPTMVGGKDCEDPQVQLCHDVCEPFTPNGCDCFGCCELPAGSGLFVFIGTGVSTGAPTCVLDDVMDPAACAPCTPMADCQKGCGRCQLCIGKTEVPEDCFVPSTDGGFPDGGGADGGAGDGGVVNPDQCPGGEQPCGLAGQAPCPESYYCVTGCCQLVIP